MRPYPSWIVWTDDDGTHQVRHLLSGPQLDNSHTSIAHHHGENEDKVLRVEIRFDPLLDAAQPPVPWTLDRLPYGTKSLADIPTELLAAAERTAHSFMTLDNVSAYITYHPDGDQLVRYILNGDAEDAYNQHCHEHPLNPSGHINDTLREVLMGLFVMAARPDRNANPLLVLSASNRPLFQVTDDMLSNPSVWPHLNPQKESTDA